MELVLCFSLTIKRVVVGLSHLLLFHIVWRIQTKALSNHWNFLLSSSQQMTTLNTNNQLEKEKKEKKEKRNEIEIERSEEEKRKRKRELLFE